jgi:hypothetical protein
MDRQGLGKPLIAVQDLGHLLVPDPRESKGDEVDAGGAAGGTHCRKLSRIGIGYPKIIRRYYEWMS